MKERTMMRMMWTLSAAAIILFSSVAVVSGTHFRYGSYNWTPLGGNTVQFTVENSFRRSATPPKAYPCVDATMTFVPCSASDGLPGVGDLFMEIIGGTEFFFGDGTSIKGPKGGIFGGLLYVVTAIDPTRELLIADAVDYNSLPGINTNILHTYPGPGNYLAYTDTCCRISNPSNINYHINNPDGGYRVETSVTVGSGNLPPAGGYSAVTAFPPIVLCPQNGLCTFTIPATDPDGDPLNFRFSTPSEASSYFPNSACRLAFCQPGPPFAPHAASVSAAGVYTWDTTGASLGPASGNTLYSTQVTIEDKDAVTMAVKSKIAVDFFIQLVPQGTPINPPKFDVPPTPTCGSTLSGMVGNTLSFNVQASDLDPETVSLNVAGLPTGASMTPPLLPAVGNPIQSVFSWMPTPRQTGTRIVTFAATDHTNRTAFCPFTLSVSTSPDFFLWNSGGVGVGRGFSGSNTISVASLAGYSQPTTLSCSSGLPTGAICIFSPSTGSPTFSSTLTISTASSTLEGQYPITVAGTGGGLTRTTQFTLTVVSPGPKVGGLLVPIDKLALLAPYIIFATFMVAGTVLAAIYMKRIESIKSSDG